MHGSGIVLKHDMQMLIKPNLLLSPELMQIVIRTDFVSVCAPSPDLHDSCSQSGAKTTRAAHANKVSNFSEHNSFVVNNYSVHYIKKNKDGTKSHLNTFDEWLCYF